MRLSDWEERFAQLVHESQLRAFRWGTFDCCTFAAHSVEALTGDDQMRMLRGRYRNWRGAAVLVRTLGGLRKAVVDILGDPIEHPAMAQRGDIVLVLMGSHPPARWPGLPGAAVLRGALAGYGLPRPHSCLARHALRGVSSENMLGCAPTPAERGD